MEEEIISFETAKLAKDKGFQEEELHYYLNGELLQHPNRLYYNFNQDNPPLNQFSAPYQSFLQKWLREVHKLIVSINIMSDLSYYSLLIDINENKLNLKNQSKNRGFSTYEEALEDGLQEALKLIE